MIAPRKKVTNDMTREQFIDAIAGYVQKYAYVYGIMVHSPVIAQAILESGWGESKLASRYHNYFGLKCGSKWTGRSVNLKTQEEYTKGTLTTISDNFRVFDSMEEGVEGYFEFIQLSRYQNLRGITDPKKYLEKIRADGYATSYSYVENCMKLITQYGLTKYDTKGERTVGKTAEDLISVTYTDTATEDSKRAAFDVCAIMDFLINTMKVEETEDEEKIAIDLYGSRACTGDGADGMRRQ